MKTSEKRFRDEMYGLAKSIGMTAVDEYWRRVDLPTFTKEITYYIFMYGETNSHLERMLWDYRLELDERGFVEFK